MTGEDAVKTRQNLIIQYIKEQVKHRIVKKYNWKRVVYKNLEHIYKKISRFIFWRMKEPSYDNPISYQQMEFGSDDLGRDITLGLKLYVDLLLKRNVKLHTVIVLGSRVKNRARPDSDTDVMIIASDLPGRSFPEPTTFPQKILNLKRWLLLSDAPLFMGIQPSACCSREEFLSWLRSLRITALDAIYYGRIIYDDGFWSKALHEFKKIEKKYRLSETNISELLSVL